MLNATADFFGFISYFAELAAGAIGFSPTAFRKVAESGAAQSAAFTIAFLAGASEMLGQSVVLVVNRVAIYRFLASLAFTGVTYVVTALIWGLTTLAVAPLTRVGALGLGDFLPTASLLALAFAPRLFGFLAIAPYIGSPLSNVLEAWSMALAIFALHVGLNLPVGAAVACGGAGWAASFILRAFLGRALAHPLRQLRVAVSGTTLEKSPAQVLEDTLARLQRDDAGR
ncbi:MAG: hypothetical protein AAFW81_03005 [Pseudomonadota bacterium]